MATPALANLPTELLAEIVRLCCQVEDPKEVLFTLAAVCSKLRYRILPSLYRSIAIGRHKKSFLRCISNNRSLAPLVKHLKISHDWQMRSFNPASLNLERYTELELLWIRFTGVTWLEDGRFALRPTAFPKLQVCIVELYNAPPRSSTLRTITVRQIQPLWTLPHLFYLRISSANIVSGPLPARNPAKLVRIKYLDLRYCTLTCDVIEQLTQMRRVSGLGLIHVTAKPGIFNRCFTAPNVKEIAYRPEIIQMDPGSDHRSHWLQDMNRVTAIRIMAQSLDSILDISAKGNLIGHFPPSLELLIITVQTNLLPRVLFVRKLTQMVKSRVPPHLKKLLIRFLHHKKCHTRWWTLEYCSGAEREGCRCCDGGTFYHDDTYEYVDGKRRSRAFAELSEACFEAGIELVKYYWKYEDIDRDIMTELRTVLPSPAWDTPGLDFVQPSRWMW